MEGYIKLHRKMLEWEWYDDANTMRLFIHCLLNANHEPNKWHGIEIKTGELLTGRLKLARALKLSEQQIRTSLNKLKSTNEITIKSTKEYSIILINNWNEYQQNNQQNNQQVTNEQPTSNQQVTTNKNEKNDKNNIHVQFEKFYETYPKKKSRQAAEKAFNSAIKKVDFETLMQGLDAYKEEIKRKNTEERFIKYPATWLHQGCWDDDYGIKEEGPIDYANAPYNPYG